MTLIPGSPHTELDWGAVLMDNPHRTAGASVSLSMIGNRLTHSFNKQ